MSETIKIPNPESPYYIDNLRTIPLLEAQGFRGIDATLAISLFEYDCIWREIPLELRDHPDEDYLFVFRVSRLRFARVGSMSCDFEKDFQWIKEEDWKSFFESHGTTREEWMELDYPQRMFDLYSHFGFMSVFGDTIWGGAFRIEDSDEY